MNLKDIVVPLIGMVVLLAFIVFMVGYYNKRQENGLLMKNLEYDSIMIKNQEELRKKDSIILVEQEIIKSEQEIIKSILRKQSNQINQIKKDTSYIYKNKK